MKTCECKYKTLKGFKILKYGFRSINNNLLVYILANCCLLRYDPIITQQHISFSE